MTTLLNSLEQGSNGTTVTTGNSGGGGDSAFDVVSVGTGATNAFDNAHAAHGSLACKIATGGTAASPYNQWGTSIGSSAQYWFRMYLFFTANPGVNHRVLAALQTSTTCGAVIVTTGGNLRFANSAGSTIFTMAGTIPLNAWFRVEGFLIGDAAVGQVELKQFNTLDSASADETKTSAATQATTGAPNLARLGVSTALANIGPFWYDDIGLSNTGYLGPAAPSGSGGVTIPKITLASAGGETFSGSGGIMLPKAALAGSGTAGAGVPGIPGQVTIGSSAPAAACSSRKAGSVAIGSAAPSVLVGSAV